MHTSEDVNSRLAETLLTTRDVRKNLKKKTVI